MAAGRSPGATNVMRTGPVVEITSPLRGTALMAVSPITLTASAFSATGAVVLVEFFSDGLKIGESVRAPYSLAWTATAGTHLLTARALDNAGVSGDSAPVTVYVQMALAVNQTLVSAKAWWRYLDDGSDQGTNWIQRSYPDNTWSNGWAELGYGDISEERPEATLIRYGTNVASKWVTYYFRKTFVLDSTNDIAGAVLGLVRDDGAAAYLNGIEVYRNNLPGGAGYLTTASTNVAGPDEYTFIPTNVPPSLLVLGSNILAVEVHQYSRGGTDLSFDAELKTTRNVLSPAVTLQPGSRTCLVGDTVTLTVASLGSAPFSYQWWFQGSPVPDATGAILTLTNASSNTAGAYFVVVTNLAGSVTSAVATVTVVNPDTDGDQMPEAWEIANGTDPDRADADADLDHDGLTNLQEYWAGTSPTNARSLLCIESIVLLPGTETRLLSIPVASNRTCTVQYRAALPSGDWFPLTNLLSAPTSRTERVVDPAGVGSRFYRVVLPQP
jgi:hypothetical protein